MLSDHPPPPQKLKYENGMTTEDDHDHNIEDYLNSFTYKKFDRIECCGSSRYLFCPECLKLLVLEGDRPTCLRSGDLRLPFRLDVVLDDRRGSATGLHAISLLHASSCAVNNSPNCNLFDTNRGEAPPTADDEDGNRADTFLLFPCPGQSVPISSVANRIRRLVVLDCKWTKPSAKHLPGLASLQKVHLTNPPAKSHFWRWHNAGVGMLSTIEAIYYAAKEVAGYRNDFPDQWTTNLICLLFLFAEQRASIRFSSAIKGRILPFSEAGKRAQRALRETPEKWAKDRELGKQMKLNSRIERKRKETEQSVAGVAQTLHAMSIN